jgi:hypothetical protein
MKYQFKKHFTIAEAAQTLPLIKGIVGDILDLSHEIHALGIILGEDAPDHPQLQEKLDELQGYLAEMEEMGCYYKDWGFSIGLVDFPAIINGQEVFLCWRSDEEEIMYYHEIDAGYAGRRRIPGHFFSEQSGPEK